MSNTLSVDQIMPVLNDLNTKLKGKNGDQVFEGLKKLLRGEESATTAINTLFNDLVNVGHYDDINPDITEDRFPMPKDFVFGTESKLFDFGRNVSSDEAIKEMNKKGYRPATIWDLLDFGSKNIKGQRKFPVVALGSVAEVHGERRVVSLGRLGSKRCLNLDWFDADFDGTDWFLAVRK